jgi:hypothetical protein
MVRNAVCAKKRRGFEGLFNVRPTIGAASWAGGRALANCHLPLSCKPHALHSYLRQAFLGKAWSLTIPLLVSASCSTTRRGVCMIGKSRLQSWLAVVVRRNRLISAMRHRLCATCACSSAAFFRIVLHEHWLYRHFPCDRMCVTEWFLRFKHSTKRSYQHGFDRHYRAPQCVSSRRLGERRNPLKRVSARSDKISSNSQYTHDTLQNYANLRRSPNQRKEALVRKRKSSTKRSRIRGARRSVHEEFWSTRYLFLHVESGPGASPLAISGPFSHAMDRHSLRQPSGYRRKVASGPTHGHVLQVCQTICYLAWRMDRLRL